MKILPKTPELLSTLQSFDTFEGISPEALQWMIYRSDYKFYDTGENLFSPGMAVEHMQIIIQGRYVVQWEQKGETRELGVWEAGYITGVLPFSRMKEAAPLVRRWSRLTRWNSTRSILWKWSMSVTS